MEIPCTAYHSLFGFWFWRPIWQAYGEGISSGLEQSQAV